MEESDFGKLGRDGFTSILLSMDPIDVVKLCWLTNLGLCDNVGWSHLLQEGFKVLPEDIPKEVDDQRLFFYNLATVEQVPLYFAIETKEHKHRRFEYHEDRKLSISAQVMPRRMRFNRFINKNDDIERTETVTYRNDDNPDNRENYYKPPPEGEKVWVMFGPWRQISFLGQYEEYVENGKVKNKETICELSANAIMEWENIGDPKDPTQLEIKQKIYNHLYKYGYYIHNLNEGVYQVGEVEFLPIWK